jgi:2-polyprenyl-3-methyl-5-hydroxy-6-metoxy-1,4-benzoquinol methylase
MLKNLLKKILYGCWNRCGLNDEKRWCDKAREDFLREAAEFLRRENLLGDGDDIGALTKKWKSIVENNFDPKKPEQFYATWQGEIGASNILANISDQFSRPYVFYSLRESLVSHEGSDLVMLDFGCGTAALSIAAQKEYAATSHLLLADVENLPRQFVKTICGRSKGRIELVDVSLGGVKDDSVDIVLCLHVLEHIKNPAEIFELIDRKIKNGGVVLLEAPWGREREHIGESLINWKGSGGDVFLNERYVKMRSMNHFVVWSGGISGVYKKI